MYNGILPLNQLALNQLKQKHRQSKEAHFNVLVTDTHEEFHPTKFDELEIELVKIAAVRTSQQKVEQKHQKWTLMTGEKFLQQNSLITVLMNYTQLFSRSIRNYVQQINLHNF